ncbi:hypothetical protein PSECIP111854_01857 [Pseudoalteromonas sp. CIP111854]|uniref:Uncharacterized protein n=1 Tax=Pseudoalteromonas holothuriae TaxID=2963714 RepID=A0A9W4QWS8_9GAMM|nr:putative capsular polysaccharide synthesis family protein [Pseudoalteromonas sp. CIP111854]CAH9056756.1 hypothetical protein PSECIP111854_01857 [Pseudoalteromonas sp. CIP111854]
MIKKIKALLALYNQYSDPDTVFIYQMGKVGSTALEDAIKGAVHIHNFYSHNHPCKLRLQGLAGFGWRYYCKRFVQECELAVKRLAFRRRKHSKVITLVREPLERNISMFFHDLDCYLFALYSNCDRSIYPPVATRTQDPEVLNDAFLKHFEHDYPLFWFDNELKRMTGVDVYKHHFDKSKRFLKAESHSCEVLCLDIRVLEQSADLLSEFLGQKVAVCFANQAERKWYGDVYATFKNTHCPSLGFHKVLKNSKYYQHFFP